MNIDYDGQETDHIFSSLIMCHTCNKPFETSEEASKCTHSTFETPTRIDQFQKSGIDKLKNKRLETMSDQRTTNKELLRIAKSHTSSVHSGGSNRSFTSMQVNEILQKQKQEMILLQNEKEKEKDKQLLDMKKQIEEQNKQISKMRLQYGKNDKEEIQEEQQQTIAFLQTSPNHQEAMDVDPSQSQQPGAEQEEEKQAVESDDDKFDLQSITTKLKTEKPVFNIPVGSRTRNFAQFPELTRQLKQLKNINTGSNTLTEHKENLFQFIRFDMDIPNNDKKAYQIVIELCSIFNIQVEFIQSFSTYVANLHMLELMFLQQIKILWKDELTECIYWMDRKKPEKYILKEIGQQTKNIKKHMLNIIKNRKKTIENIASLSCGIIPKQYFTPVFKKIQIGDKDIREEFLRKDKERKWKQDCESMLIGFTAILKDEATRIIKFKETIEKALNAISLKQESQGRGQMQKEQIHFIIDILKFAEFSFSKNTIDMREVFFRSKIFRSKKFQQEQKDKLIQKQKDENKIEDIIIENEFGKEITIKANGKNKKKNSKTNNKKPSTLKKVAKPSKDFFTKTYKKTKGKKTKGKIVKDNTHKKKVFFGNRKKRKIKKDF